MKFASTKRKTYTKESVNKLRQKRKLMTPKREGVSQGGLDMMLGDLKAAGHLMINGFKNMGVENSRVGPTSPLNKGSYTFEFDCYSEDGFGERPHLQGYLESASNADKTPYRIKGWFNSDGSIRIELVK
jgi:hypothetical protein